MTREEILEYLRTYAALKRNLVDKMGLQQKVDPYSDIIKEIDNLTLLLAGDRTPPPLEQQ